MADLNSMAARIVREATEAAEPESSHAAAGRKGGKKGGKARAEKMTPEERSESARKAAAARWTQSHQE